MSTGEDETEGGELKCSRCERNELSTLRGSLGTTEGEVDGDDDADGI